MHIYINTWRLFLGVKWKATLEPLARSREWKALRQNWAFDKGLFKGGGWSDQPDLIHQVIQFVTFLSPNVGLVTNNHLKKGHQQNCQDGGFFLEGRSKPGWWQLKDFYPENWWNDPIWLIVLNWLETTN